nr:hypothetical protein [Enterococcus faecalis]
MISVGILGEYVGRVFLETKKRPLYFVENIYSLPKKNETKESELKEID